MSLELETAGAASVGGLTTRQKADLSGQPCQNCGTHVEDRFCPACGQLAATFHRPIMSLVAETISDTLTLDGRLARTLPILLFRPGRLTKNYTEGKRARYVPPFRLFLLASLLFYLVLFAVVPPGQFINIDDQTRADITTSLTEDLDDPEAAEIQETVRQRLAENNITVTNAGEARGDIEERLLMILENQDQFAAQLENWLPRLSILIVPLTALAFVVLHFWRRKIYVYDHAIHALHLHSWMYLTGTVVMLIGPIMPDIILTFYFIGFLIYVWRSLAVAGSTGMIMSGIRMFMMLVFWTIVTAIIMLSTVIISGMSVHG